MHPIQIRLKSMYDRLVTETNHVENKNKEITEKETQHGHTQHYDRHTFMYVITNHTRCHTE